jgi:phosphate-selective porin OprO/OprP
MLIIALAVADVSGTARNAAAQSLESQPVPAPGQYEPAPLPAMARPFLIPDVPQADLEKLKVDDRYFTLRLGLAALYDYTAFSQDDASVSQVGIQSDQGEVRDLRLMLRGSVGGGYKVNYFVAGVYKGFDSEPETTWELIDLALTFPIRGPATKLTVGKTKETFTYEMVGDSASLPQQERVLSPFFVSRNIGVKVLHVLANQRLTAAAGVFNDWFATDTPHSDSGTDVSFRVTGLVWDRPDTNEFLHLAISGRQAGADDDALRYKGRPESNVSDNYVDTGNLPAEDAWHTGLEALWTRGPVSVLAEYNHAAVDSPATGNPSFYGYYLTGSWILRGGVRRYDRTVGFARRVLPGNHLGAPELVARFAHVDLDDAGASGGTFDKTYVGLNWWATRRWKFGTGWGRTSLDRFGTTGVTNAWHSRIQWIF